MRIKLTEFDPSAYLDNDEIIAEYLTLALKDGNPDVFLSAVGDVAKARGMTAIAESTGLGRESLYKAFASGAKPRYDTVLKVLSSFGVKLNVTTSLHDRASQGNRSKPSDMRAKYKRSDFGKLVRGKYATQVTKSRRSAS